MARTLQDVLALCREKDVSRLWDFKMTDIDGRWRYLCILVTASMRTNSLSMASVFDGSNYGYAPVENSDMVSVPDLDSATMDPLRKSPPHHDR